jgi:hypothetical protein
MKVCILAAGLGTRLGAVSETVHKALLPLGNQAVVSRIMAGFPPDTEFVIATGSKGEQVEAFVRLAHPTARVRFVRVELFAGPGSGPGYSLYCCRDFLREPFVFTACDTLVLGPLPAFERNWLGVAEVADASRWCAAHVDADAVGNLRVTALDDKLPGSTARHAFTGIAFVRDHEAFWAGLAPSASPDGRGADNGEAQVAGGLAALLGTADGLSARPVAWRDTGSWDAYQALLADFDKNYTFTGKSTEVTFRYGQRVLKLFADKARGERWRARVHSLGRAVPELLGGEGPVAAYRFVSGTLLSESLDGTSCRSFLDWLEAEFWRDPAPEDAPTPEVFAAALRAFYVDKSLARLADYARRHPDSRAAGPGRLTINGVSCRPAGELVLAAEAVACAPTRPSVVHGDLHADNVLVTPGDYCLIDWREGFAGLACGDRHYDLAKFLHTLDLSVATMEAGAYKADWRSGSSVVLSHLREEGELRAREAFEDFVRQRGYDRRRIEVVNSLVFLNMSPLYDRPMGEYLCLLGRLLLERALTEARL